LLNISEEKVKSGICCDVHHRPLRFIPAYLLGWTIEMVIVLLPFRFPNKAELQVVMETPGACPECDVPYL
jgi:hypothetical protein